MIEPTGLLEPKTRKEQELTVLYIIAVAGKTSEHAVNVIGKFAFHTKRWECSFQAIRDLWITDSLREVMRECKISPYRWKYKAFVHVMLKGTDRDLKSITPDEWSNVGGSKVGIGPKTSRYICMCLDPENARYAALDTHVLKWLRHLGYDAPKATPPAGEKYNALEAVFLHECDIRGKNPAKLDLEVWEAYKYGLEIPK